MICRGQPDYRQWAKGIIFRRSDVSSDKKKAQIVAVAWEASVSNMALAGLVLSVLGLGYSIFSIVNMVGS